MKKAKRNEIEIIYNDIILPVRATKGSAGYDFKSPIDFTLNPKDTIKLETFIHGSMCYCYSGACLMSSFIGGESGDRGRCKGPCRLPYKAIVAKQQRRGELCEPERRSI